jgi:hypothetical protein
MEGHGLHHSLLLSNNDYMDPYKTLSAAISYAIKNPAFLSKTGYLSANPYSLQHGYTGWNFFNGLSYTRIAIMIPI